MKKNFISLRTNFCNLLFISSIHYIFFLPVYLYKEIILQFFIKGRDENILGYGVICNYPTNYVQKKFLNNGGSLFGIDFNSALGYPYNYFAPPLRLFFIQKCSYPIAILINLLLFYLSIVWIGMRLGHSSFAVILGLSYILSAYAIWYNVGHYMVFLFGLVPLFWAITFLIHFNNLVLSVICYCCLFYIWPPLSVTLFIPICLILVIHNGMLGLMFYVSIFGIVIFPYVFVNLGSQRKSRYRQIQKKRQFSRQKSKMIKNGSYFCLSLLSAYRWGISEITLILLLISVILYIDSFHFSFFNSDYWQVVYNLILLLWLLHDPDGYIFLLFILITNSTDYFNHFKRSYGGMSLNPISADKDTINNVKSLFENVPSQSRVAVEVVDRDHKDISIDAPKTYRLCHIIHFIKDYALKKDIEFVYGVGCFECEESIYQKIVKQFYYQNTRKEIKTAIELGGINYIIGITDEFREKMNAMSFIKCCEIKRALIPEYGQLTLSLYIPPFKVFKITPMPEKQVIDRNEISFTAKKGERYMVRYAYYKGWKAYLDGSEISIIDKNPGMEIHTHFEGRLCLLYRYRHYFIQS